MQKICCQGNRGERVRASASEAAISPECQDCRCRRRAQRSTLAGFGSCSLHMRMLPFVAAHIKTEFYICRLRGRHKRERHGLLLLYQFWLFLHLTLLLTSGPLISPVFTSLFSPSLPLPIYRRCFCLCSPYTCLLSRLLFACQTQNCFIRAARINCAAAEVGCTRLKTSKKKEKATLRSGIRQASISDWGC